MQTGRLWGISPKSCGVTPKVLALAVLLRLIRPTRAEADNFVDYRYGLYREDAGRMEVNTQSALFQQELKPWLSLKGEVVFDAISGATPTGAPPPSQINFFGPVSTDNYVPTTHLRDQRWAGSLDALFTLGRHRITPEFSYSSEHDYTSRGAALNYAVDFNERNTTLNLGWSHDWDRILPNSGTYISDVRSKDTDGFLVGLSQVLGPTTVLTGDFTFRNSSGYQADPYRGVVFDDYPQFDPTQISLFPESRPEHRETCIGYLALTQMISPVNASVDASARVSHDSFNINGYTAALTWNQKLGKRVLFSPQFRYFRQTAASFYATHFAGDPTNPFDPTPIPAYYSADYRLSKLDSLTFGASVSVKATDWLTLNASFQRYEMRGLDGVTSPSAYPKANIITMGARINW
jgi:Protein of unknown function (DUF3570)